MAALIRQQRTGTERVGEYGVFARNLVFYLRFKQEIVTSEAHARGFLRSPERVLLVARAADLPALEAAAGAPLHLLGEVRYFNTGNIKLRTLLVPDPAVDVQRVMLVSNRP
jgi:hypothetical protein